MKHVVSLLTVGLLFIGATLFAQETAKPRTYSMILQGAV
jgi:hypothetical protein